MAVWRKKILTKGEKKIQHTNPESITNTSENFQIFSFK
jgi:hypothetical protein